LFLDAPSIYLRHVRKKPKDVGAPDQNRFREQVSICFRWLEDGHRFHARQTREYEVQYLGVHCRVVIAWERGDLFVDLITNEAEPIRRLRLSLSQLVAVRVGMSSIDAVAYLDRSRSLAERLRSASELLLEYGSDFLAGDPLLRSQIVRVQVTAWLLDKYDDIIVKGKYHSIESGCKQLAWELGKQGTEHRLEFQQVLSDWISDEGPRGTFAAKLVECSLKFVAGSSSVPQDASPSGSK